MHWLIICLFACLVLLIAWAVIALGRFNPVLKNVHIRGSIIAAAVTACVLIGSGPAFGRILSPLSFYVTIPGSRILSHLPSSAFDFVNHGFTSIVYFTAVNGCIAAGLLALYAFISHALGSPSRSLGRQAASMRTFLFIFFTWGAIVGIPIACFFATRGLWPTAHALIPVGVSVAVFLFGVLSGEWFARLITGTLDRIFSRRDAQSHDNAA